MGPKFSKQIFADPECFYVSCPETIGEHIARKLSRFRTCVELCCAVGMLLVQLAKVMDKVYAVDIDRQRIEFAKKNAALYGVGKKIEFIQGNVLDEELYETLSAEVAIIDPSWRRLPLEDSQKAQNVDETYPNMRKMVELTRKHITKNFVSRIPTNFTFETLKDFGPCKIENVIWEGRLRFKIAYFFEGEKNNEESTVSFE